MRSFGLALLITLFTCNSSAAEEVRNVSIIQLIANPQKYDGQLVRVVGFMHLEFEGDALYQYREDYERAILNNGIWLSLTDPQERSSAKLNDRYVLVEGRFKAEEKGHFASWSGSLQQISRVSDRSVNRSKRGPSKR